jgi:asparagine synthase (glutamine-hydrolysing)
MCGFAGFLDNSMPHSDLNSAIKGMVATLTHRGPDAEGFYVRDGIALGHRRLSILDLSPSGAQPMSLGDMGPCIAFNGEVYNFLALRRELEALGRKFQGHSDTEVMLHAYAEWGLEGLKRFEGIFGFALWNPVEKRLILMRDRFGIKPLFFARRENGLIFGSEIKALLSTKEVDTTIDSQAFAEYLWYGNAYHDRTMYQSVRSLLPGHWLIIEEEKTRIEPWWKLEDWRKPELLLGNQQETTSAVRKSIDVAVKRQLVADVPVGLFLSGGIDSSAIAASAMSVQSKPLASFSVGFDFDQGVNELPKAKLIAEHLGLNHHEVHVSGADLKDVLVTLAYAHDEPFADAANIPLYLLCRQLGGSIKVVLQGDGGDEMFAGYRRHAILENVRYWKLWPRRATPIIQLLFGGRGGRFARMVTAVGAKDSALRMALLLTLETLDNAPTTLLTQDVQNNLTKVADPFLAYKECALRFHDVGAIEQMLLTDLTLQLPSQFLAKVDRSTMACGIEARVPLLDEGVAKLAMKIPTKWKVNGVQKKIILRDAFRGRLPKEVLDGPKTGFGVPYEHWLRTSLYEFTCDAILNPAFVARFGLDRIAVENTLKIHRNGKGNKGFILWKILQLALWHQASTSYS